MSEYSDRMAKLDEIEKLAERNGREIEEYLNKLLSEREIKPCPLCGGEARLMQSKFHDGDFLTTKLYHIHCTKCNLRSDVALSPSYIINHWNKRK